MVGNVIVSVQREVDHALLVLLRRALNSRFGAMILHQIISSFKNLLYDDITSYADFYDKPDLKSKTDLRN
jgi:hypothetical protein